MILFATKNSSYVPAKPGDQFRRRTEATERVDSEHLDVFNIFDTGIGVFFRRLCASRICGFRACARVIDIVAKYNGLLRRVCSLQKR